MWQSCGCKAVCKQGRARAEYWPRLDWRNIAIVGDIVSVHNCPQSLSHISYGNVRKLRDIIFTHSTHVMMIEMN